MRIERVQAKQGHPVPKRAGYAQGPFPPELLRSPEVITDYEPQSDGGGPPIPDEGTAQNGFKAFRWFKCKDCDWVLREDELNKHECLPWQEDEEYDDDDE